jgi:RNA polymerase sigma-70 factor (ECF subfamily)
VALVVAARKGDPAAFARIIEHWNPHLRPFVHHVLAGEGSTDRALSAAYVRAYRALPRYRAERKPGLWLHRIAYLAATDELRRVRRDPARRRALADAGRSDDPALDTGENPWSLSPPTELEITIDEPLREGDGTDEEPTESAIIEARNLIALEGRPPVDVVFPRGWRRLAPDQRALAVMVDLEGYRIDDAASALDAEADPAQDRLNSARRLLGRPRTNAVGRSAVTTGSTIATLAPTAAAPPSASSLSPTMSTSLGSTRSRSQAVRKIFGSGLISPTS